MIVIGERINGMYRKVGKAIQEGNKEVIQQLAREQVEAGAHMLDVNTGPAAANPVAAMEWLVTSIQEVVDVSLCLDSTKPAVIEAGLRLCKQKGVINSTTGQKEKMDVLLPLAAKYGASIIGLTMDEKGIPRDALGRSEIAVSIIAAAMDQGIPVEDIYLDPLILPVNVTQTTSVEVLKAIHDFKTLSDPSPKTILGLSNVSQGTPNRSLINRTYLVMAMAMGLDAAIMDSTDRELMDAMITAEILLNKSIYCDSYLDAYRRR